MGTRRTGGWVVTTLLLVGALLAGCSADVADEPDPVSQTPASDPGQADKARSGPVECSELWRPGRSLPQRYNGCSARGGTVVPVLLACRDGGSLVIYRDRMYAVTGQRVTGIRGDVSTDRRYARTYANCLGSPAGNSADGSDGEDSDGEDGASPPTTTPPPPPTAAAGPSAYQDGHIWLTTELDGLDVPEVRAVQVRLNAIGYPVVVDGSYGPQTAGAVSDFQETFGLYVDGIVGPETHAALFGLTH